MCSITITYSVVAFIFRKTLLDKLLPILTNGDKEISSAESNRLLGHIAACAEAMLGVIGALSMYENKIYFYLGISVSSGCGMEVGGKIKVTDSTLKTAETVGRGKLGKKEYKTNFLARWYDSFDAFVAEGGIVEGVNSDVEQWKLAAVKVGWTEQEPSSVMEGGESTAAAEGESVNLKLEHMITRDLLGKDADVMKKKDDKLAEVEGSNNNKTIAAVGEGGSEQQMKPGSNDLLAEDGNVPDRRLLLLFTGKVIW